MAKSRNGGTSGPMTPINSQKSQPYGWSFSMAPSATFISWNAACPQRKKTNFGVFTARFCHLLGPFVHHLLELLTSVLRQEVTKSSNSMFRENTGSGCGVCFQLPQFRGQIPSYILQRLLLLRGKGYRHAGFSSWGLQAWLLPACGIFLDPGSNPCPLCWKVDSYPLYHQGSPYLYCLDYWSFAVEIEIWRFEIDKCEFCSFFFSPQH